MTSLARLLIVLAAILAASVSAGAAAAKPAAAAGGLCNVARGVAHDIVESTSVADGSVTAAKLKSTYLTIAHAEPALLAAASGRNKVDLRRVFSFVNVVIADFEKVAWRPGGITRYIPALLPRARKAELPIHRLGLYFRGTCKLDV